jgi:hypothetical protein
VRRINVELVGGPWDGHPIDDTEPVSRYQGVRQHDDGTFHIYRYEPANYHTPAGRHIYRLVLVAPCDHPSTRSVNP